MNGSKLAGITLLTLSLALSGCVARTYNLTRDRIDQDLTSSSGNRGYLMGVPPEAGERKATRTVRVVEVELGFSKELPARSTAVQPAPAEEMVEVIEVQETLPAPAEQTFESYTVGKNDTLQKISRKFYGTTRKWKDIYEANKDVLRTPDKLYPGQTLKIPSAMAEPKENLK
jgi:nucleoid-associated protein YgaU